MAVEMALIMMLGISSVQAGSQVGEAATPLVEVAPATPIEPTDAPCGHAAAVADISDSAQDFADAIRAELHQLVDAVHDRCMFALIAVANESWVVHSGPLIARVRERGTRCHRSARVARSSD